MYPLFFNHNLFFKNAELLEAISKNSMMLFTGNWLENSAWKGWKYLVDDYKDSTALVNSSDLTISLFKMVVSLFDSDCLKAINESLKKFGNVFSVISNVSSSQSLTSENVVLTRVLTDLDLEISAVKKMSSQIASLREERQKEALHVLTGLSDSYQKAKKEIVQAGSIFCYYQPEKRYVKIEDLLLEIENNDVKDWPSAFRHLGQKLFDNGEGAKEWAAFVIADNDFNQEMRSDFTSYLLGLTIFYLAMMVFEYLPLEMQKKIFGKYFWTALLLEAPFEDILKMYLAHQYALDFYIGISGSFADALESCQYPVYSDSWSNLTIGGLLAKFKIAENKAGDNRIDFVGRLIRDNKWPNEIESALHRLFFVYSGLRNCNYIDYRGFLSMAGLADNPIDWKNILNKDLGDEEIKIVKDYFRLNPIPFPIRMDMIVTFMDFHWQEEPYLSRALLLSELYEEAFGPVYPALLYFDEATNSWKLNVTFPPRERLQ